MYDVIIIGAGVIGSAIARALSRYDMRVCVIEREEDVCCGTSKANSGIVHSGFDAPPGSNKAFYNVKGNEMFEELSKELDVPFYRNGSMVLCFQEDKMFKLEELLEQGIKKGVKELRILGKEELKEMEPNVSEDAVGALYAPTGGIVCPFQLTIALAENANENGVEFFLNQEVKDIQRVQDGYVLTTKTKTYKSRIVVNAAGVYGDIIHNMVSKQKIKIIPRKGEYILFDKVTGGYVEKTIFQLPTEYGKGVLITPTVHGNLMIGPTATDIEDREGIYTTGIGLKEVIKKASLSVKRLPLNQTITSFAGLRAHEEKGDFIIGEANDSHGFIDAVGIESPGLTAAPAIGNKIREIIVEQLQANKKKEYISYRKDIRLFSEMTTSEKAEVIRQQPEYGNIVCRCETVTEGEILAAIHRPLGAKTLSGIKRRTRGGMGRCQGGFCASKTLEILQRELGKAPCKYVMKQYDIVIVGGGPAGLAAAVSAKENGINSILILERDRELGGILNQCIHNGFGLHTFKEELTGPEYAGRYIAKVKELDIEYQLNAMVIDMNKDKQITAVSKEKGLLVIQAQAIILAMGCRERPRGAINIPGYRPAGIYSAGAAQKLVNMEGLMPGKEIVILGSGDIGLIMARRMTLEGAHVKLVAEIMPYSGGLKRNIVQCLDDYHIPLKLSHTVVNIHGKERLEGVTLAQVDDNKEVNPQSEEFISCDTLLLSVGLIPENELSINIGLDIDQATSGAVVDESLETNIEGIFACGNVLHVHDLVDYVTEEAMNAGKNAARYIRDHILREEAAIELIPGRGIRYVVPRYIRINRMEETQKVRYRVDQVYKQCAIVVYYNEQEVLRKKKRILTPGEMEDIIIKKEELKERYGTYFIKIEVEEA